MTLERLDAVADAEKTEVVHAKYVIGADGKCFCAFLETIHISLKGRIRGCASPLASSWKENTQVISLLLGSIMMLK